MMLLRIRYELATEFQVPEVIPVFLVRLSTNISLGKRPTVLSIAIRFAVQNAHTP